MISRSPLSACLLLCVAGALASNDLVNERPPVSTTELEQHWGVDCAALRSALLSGFVPEDAERHLQLCAAIHQPPGVARTQGCPDFAAAAALLATPAADNHVTDNDNTLAITRKYLLCAD